MTAVTITTTGVPIVENQEDGTYLLEFDDASTSVLLTEAQLDGLVSRALAAKLVDPDEDDKREPIR